MACVLVTGGAGYVGSICSEELIRQGYDVVVVDDLSTGHIQAVPAKAAFHQLDIGDALAVAAVLHQYEFDAMFHFAARALIPESVTDPAIFFRVNVSSALSMLDAVRTAGIKKFVFSSTAAVYGSPTQVPITEDHPKSPVNSYGETKLCFERALQWYARAYGIDAVAFRYFNACGATEEHGELHDPETHIIPLLLEVAAGERDHFTIYGGDYGTSDGTCLRDYVHVLDIARAHILALRSTSPGFSAYNIGTGRCFSVREIHQAVERITGRKIAVEIGPRRAGDPDILQAAPHKLMRDLHWYPEHSALDDIIRGAWSWKNRALVERAA
jgi:UDP-glucose 4-epimerase